MDCFASLAMTNWRSKHDGRRRGRSSFVLRTGLHGGSSAILGHDVANFIR
jgi:hypothetical protein